MPSAAPFLCRAWRHKRQVQYVGVTLSFFTGLGLGTLCLDLPLIPKVSVLALSIGLMIGVTCTQKKQPWTFSIACTLALWCAMVMPWISRALSDPSLSQPHLRSSHF